jgi:GNAT superfamily N-acetyltransferase
MNLAIRTLPESDLAAADRIYRLAFGSFGFFGPLTVRPDLWDQGIASRLVAAAVERFDSWGLAQTGLYTFAASIKHVRLYQKYGCWPGHLTMILSAHIAPPAVVPDFNHPEAFVLDDWR